MTKIEHRPLGRTGIDVSIIGFGAAPLANLFREVPESMAIETVFSPVKDSFFVQICQTTYDMV